MSFDFRPSISDFRLPLTSPRHNLAIELSSPRAAIALGRGDEPPAVATLPDKRRHNLDLMPTLDTLCRSRGIGPGELAEVYVSLGPGSFTGLRVAVATAQTLALALGVKIVGIPTLDVLLAQHPGHVVCLNIKRDTAWSAGPGLEPAIRSLEELRATALPLVADLPALGTPHAAPESAKGLALPVRPDVRVLYRLARTRAAAGDYDDPLKLLPLYIREPEAVTLWNQKHTKTER